MWSKDALIRTNSERSECLICLNFKNTRDKIVVQAHMSSYSYKTKDQKVKNNPESVFSHQMMSEKEKVVNKRLPVLSLTNIHFLKTMERT